MDDFQRLVYTRWQALPKGYSVSVGGVGVITKEEALEHLAENDEVGKILIAVDRNYFDAIKSGELYASLGH